MMTVGVCFKSEHRGWMQDQWSWVFSNFGITDIWEMAASGSSDNNVYQPVTSITAADELPSEPTLIAVTPIEATFYPGDENLAAFIHPENAIYMFGGSQSVMHSDDFNGRVPDHKVYIPTVKLEMYSQSSAYIVLWDRYTKRGDFG